MTFLERMEALGRAGMTVSIVYGPCGDRGLQWSVNVLSPDGREFARPFLANDALHALDIAELEIHQRGWDVRQ